MKTNKKNDKQAWFWPSTALSTQQLKIPPNLVQKIKLLMVFFSIAWSSLSFAQLTGFGNGITNRNFGTLSSPMTEEHRIDEAFARVTSISGNNITINNRFGTWPNGIALIIQMKGGTVGLHESFDFSISGNTITVTGSLTHTYDLSTGSKVQVVFIPEYDNFTLNGGTITCEPWDGNRGGILAFMVKNDLNINGGRFNVTGRGYLPEGVTFANGGTGGAGSNTYLGTGGGMPGQNSDLYCTVSPHPTLSAGGTGSDGDPRCTTCFGSNGSQNTGSGVIYGTSTFNTSTSTYYILMGDAGYSEPNYGSGEGADGGAHGGEGSNNPTPGSSGFVGDDGGNGGAAGTGGRGGGIIYIKANNINFPATPLNHAVFLSHGGNGKNGLPGGKGGTGGMGGTGGPGDCALLIGNGGSGGAGITGYGGEGGDGANGGQPGTIWVLNNGVSNFQSSYFSIQGGFGGQGGKSGFGIQPTITPSLPPISPCQALCPTPPCNPVKRDIEKCDCDLAHSLLFDNLSGVIISNNTTESRYEFMVGTELRGWYNYGTTEVVGISYGDNTTGIPHCDDYYYKCPMYGEVICNLIYEQLALQRTTEVNTNIDLLLTNLTPVGSTIEMFFSDDDINIDAIVYYGTSDPKKTVDYLSYDQNECIEVPCEPIPEYGEFEVVPGKGNGNSGTSPGDPVTIPSLLPINLPTLVVNSGSSPFFVAPERKPGIKGYNYDLKYYADISVIEISKLVVKENVNNQPVNTEITVDIPPSINQVQMLDGQGKLIQANVNITETITTLSNFKVPSGVYYIKILFSNGEMDTYKLFIN